MNIVENLFGYDLSIKYIKELGLEKTDKNLNFLIKIFYENTHNIEFQREIVSSIGRQKNNDVIYDFLKKEIFNKHYMEVIYQMFRTLLYKSAEDKRFEVLRNKSLEYYKNEVMQKMFKYYEFKHKNKNRKEILNKQITKPTLLIGDNCETLQKIDNNQIQLIFTSPPYYNARLYSDYINYADYLKKMKNTLVNCHRVLEDGRFIIINVSPVITKRAGREFESIRYPIHFDFHKILLESGFYFVDEIIWIKPEYCVPNRNAGYLQTKKPLSYKPNCITESIMVYRKDSPFLLDENIKKYDKKIHNDDNMDSTNCWHISPSSSKDHPAVFPTELCHKILKYYSFEGDIVCDTFAGSGTFGKVAKSMGRIPILCEQNIEYAKKIKQGGFYEL